MAKQHPRLWRLAQPKLKSLAERKIFRAHGTFDVEDVMMIVFATLCRKLSTGQIGPLPDATHLIKHLAIMTRHAVIDLVRYENRRCRSAGMDTTRRVALESLVGRGPGPRSQATHRDVVTQLADSLGQPRTSFVADWKGWMVAVTEIWQSRLVVRYERWSARWC